MLIKIIVDIFMSIAKIFTDILTNIEKWSVDFFFFFSFFILWWKASTYWGHPSPFSKRMVHHHKKEVGGVSSIIWEAEAMINNFPKRSTVGVWSSRSFVRWIAPKRKASNPFTLPLEMEVKQSHHVSSEMAAIGVQIARQISCDSCCKTNLSMPCKDRHMYEKPQSVCYFGQMSISPWHSLDAFYNRICRHCLGSSPPGNSCGKPSISWGESKGRERLAGWCFDKENIYW